MNLKPIFDNLIEFLLKIPNEINKNGIKNYNLTIQTSIDLLKILCEFELNIKEINKHNKDNNFSKIKPFSMI